MWYFYIARCADNSLYLGISSNTYKRIVRHNKGDGARWFLKHGPGTIVYQGKFVTFKEARSREAQIKRWSRVKKEKLINGEHPSTPFGYRSGSTSSKIETVDRPNRPRSG